MSSSASVLSSGANSARNVRPYLRSRTCGGGKAEQPDASVAQSQLACIRGHALQPRLVGSSDAPAGCRLAGGLQDSQASVHSKPLRWRQAAAAAPTLGRPHRVSGISCASRLGYSTRMTDVGLASGLACTAPSLRTLYRSSRISSHHAKHLPQSCSSRKGEEDHGDVTICCGNAAPAVACI